MYFKDSINRPRVEQEETDSHGIHLHVHSADELGAGYRHSGRTTEKSHVFEEMMRRAGGLWEPGSRRWLIERRRIGPVMNDSDLERQGALLRRLAAGEAVSEQVDWPHVVEEIEHGRGQRDDQDEIAHLRARLSAAEALIKELRARLDDTASKLTNSQAELTTAQSQAEAATARAVAAVEAKQAIRQAERRTAGEGTLGAAQGGVEGAVTNRYSATGPFFSEAAAVLKPGSSLLLAELAGHVDEAEFTQELAAAAQSGLVVVSHPSVRGCRAALLRKSAD